MEVLDTLHKVHRAAHVDSFDFSTLYTKIPHSLLLKSMAKLIRDAFSCRDAKYITVDEKRRTRTGVIKHKKMQVSSNWMSMSYKRYLIS